MSTDEFVVPPALEPGDKVAIVATSSGAAATFPHVYELGLERIREAFDLEPIEYPTATADQETLSADPEMRARDIEEAFRDPEISGVITTLGGDDQIRFVDQLDPDVLRENPTRFFGYSDNTILASYLWQQGIVSYYGPSVLTEFAMQGSMFDHTVEYSRRALFEESIGEIGPAEFFSDHDLNWADPDNLERRRETEPSDGWRWAGGSDDATGPVTGRTWGGCLTVLDQLLAANVAVPEPADVDGDILLLETSEVMPEPWYARQFLIAMGERGLLERFDGVIVGRAKARNAFEEPPADERVAYRDELREAIEATIALYNPDVPIVFDVEFGHCAPTVPVPVGAMATIDPAEARISFDGA
ncbi:putative MccF-like protein (microcin C7 resistance) [Halovivax ruber XH-70]|uniref:Putative MccF-like protein (Microcin C7 resistance) n=1 Tax=Halovivax ruber (strain DSM 18193 / JCM 13892 / XH-70) TaxID=797302 RepID=L0I7M6_HALRX|nr:S66 peptidase family protein [Halovivax ruber]AGB14694.1 putative MccF-like protein (microcin C7 resistance) [Halovivax ruber XH-70]